MILEWAGVSRRWRDVVPLLLWMGLIFWLSSRSVLVTIEGEATEKLFYKSAHMAAYGVLAWCWWRVLSVTRQTDWPVLGWAFIFTVLYAVSDEVHQWYVPGRHGQLADVLFDAGGALAMILLIRRVRLLRL